MPESGDRPIATPLPFPRRALAPRSRGPDWLASYEAQHPGSIARLYQAYGGAGPIAVDRAVCQVLAPIAYRQGVTLTVTTLRNYRLRRLGLKTPRHDPPFAPALPSPQEPSLPAVLPQEVPPQAPASRVTPPPGPGLLVCRHCGRGILQVPLETAQLIRVWAYLAQEAQGPSADATRKE